MIPKLPCMSLEIKYSNDIYDRKKTCFNTIPYLPKNFNYPLDIEGD